MAVVHKEKYIYKKMSTSKRLFIEIYSYGINIFQHRP